MTRILSVHKTYKRIGEKKDKIFRPVVALLSSIKVTPNMVSYSSIVAMTLFIFLARDYMTYAVVLVIICILSDQVDGMLARYLDIASDKGKFVDMVCDNLTFTLFIIGLVYAKIISGLWGIIFVYFMLTSKMFRSIYHSQLFKSDWKFKAIAGTVPNIAAAFSFGLYIVYAFWNVNYLNITSIFFSFVLLVDSALFYFRVLKR